MSKPIAEPLAVASPSIAASNAAARTANTLGATALSMIVLGALALGTSVTLPTPAHAEIEYPWCVVYSGNEGDSGVNCGFVSREQCLATAHGAGGIC